MMQDKVDRIHGNLANFQAAPTCASRILAAEGIGCSLVTDPAGQVNLLLGQTPVYAPGPILSRVAQEARGLLKDQNPDLVVFFGLGLGWHLEHLRQQTSAPIVVFEPSVEVAAFVLARVSMDLPDIHLATTRDAFCDMVGSLVAKDQPSIVAGALPACRNLFPDQFGEFRKTVEDQLMARRIHQATRHRFSARWVANLAQNLSHLGNAPPVRILGEDFRGKPAIVVGAGPSLDANMEALARARGRALIVATHTAVIPMARAGVTPDLVIIIEGQKLDRYFAGVENLHEMVLLPSPQTHPIHLELGFKGILGLCLEGNAAADWQEKAYADRPLASGGSVACAAYSVLHDLGCDPLICVGMDMAYADGRSHARGTEFGCCNVVTDEANRQVHLHCRKGRHNDKSFDIDLATAWGGEGLVASRPQLTNFRHWFEDAARTWLTGVRLINAGGMGARIRGFEEMGLDEALDRYATADLPSTDLIAGALARTSGRDPAPLAAIVRRELDTIRKAGKIATKAAALAEQVVRKGKVTPSTRTRAMLQELGRLEKRLREMTRRTRLLNTMVGHRVQEAATEPAPNDPGERLNHSLRQSARISRIIAEGANELLAIYEPQLTDLEACAGSSPTPGQGLALSGSSPHS